MNTVRLAFPWSKICRLFITYSVSWFVCISLSLTQPHTHTLSTPPWLSSNMLLLSHLLFPIFTVKLPWHCLLQCTLNTRGAGVKLSSECVCHLSAAAENTELRAGAACVPLQSELTNNLELSWMKRTSKSRRRLCHTAPAPIHFTLGSTRDSLWRQSRPCVSFWSECRFSCNLRHLRGWE